MHLNVHIKWASRPTHRMGHRGYRWLPMPISPGQTGWMPQSCGPCPAPI